MKSNIKLVAVFMLVLMLLLSSMMVSVTPALSENRGPKIDKLRFKVIEAPYNWLDAMLVAMQNGELDVWTDLRRPSDIEELSGDEFTITSASYFHMGLIGFNIRPDQSYRGRSEVGPVLSDINFRHACFHAHNQEAIYASPFGYTVTPIQSLVPPAQGAWSNPNVPKHPYNPGDKHADTNEKDAEENYITRYPLDHSSSGILRYGGYVYSPDLSNWVTPFDLDGDGTAGTVGVSKQEFDNFIQDPDDVIPNLYLLWPMPPICCILENTYAERFADDCNAIGIPLIAMAWEFSEYLELVYDYADFDLYIGFHSLGRFPDHLYYMCHSSQDCLYYPSRLNAPGISDPELDEKLETIMFSLGYTEKMAASHDAQRMLYDENNSQSALAYMPMYSRMSYNAFNSGLRGLINSHGYGSDNSWTYLNTHWEPGHPNERIETGESTVIWGLEKEPDKLNPCSSKETREWGIMNRIYDPLTAINPYTHEDLPWLTESWEILEDRDGVPGAMNVTFNLGTNVYWQDGEPYTAEDARFNWLFLRDNEIPRYSRIWEHIVDVEVVSTYTVKAVLDIASQWLLYDLSETAALLPPSTWADWDGRPLNEILGRNPSEETGPQPDPDTPWYCPTNLYGTGPFIFDHYDAVLIHLDLLQNPNYFMTEDEISAQIADMFHEIGDVGQFPLPGPWNEPDGLIDVWDMTYLTFNFGYFWFEPPTDPDDQTDPGYRDYLDINSDGVIDTVDISSAAFYQGKQKEYP